MSMDHELAKPFWCLLNVIWPNSKVLAHFSDFKLLLHFHLSSLISRLIIKKIPKASLKTCMLHVLSLFVLLFPILAATMLYKNNHRRQPVTKHLSEFSSTCSFYSNWFPTLPATGSCWSLSFSHARGLFMEWFTQLFPDPADLFTLHNVTSHLKELVTAKHIPRVLECELLALQSSF